MPKLPALQSMRALAALLVVFDHAADLAAGHGLPTEPLHSFALFAGAQGVALFFLLSGFIMVYTTPGHAESRPVERARRFAARRILRVVPLYWLLTALIAIPTFVLSLMRPVHITLADDLRSFLFIPYADFAGHMTPILPVGWTLNYEMAFYALFAATLLLPRRLRTLTLLSTLTLAVPIGSHFYPVDFGSKPHTTLAFLTHPIIFLFGFGAALGSLKLRYPGARLPVPAVPSVLLLLVLNGSVFLSIAAPEPTVRCQALFWTVDLVALALCAFGFRTLNTNPMFILLQTKLEAIGDASYSLYLIHLLPVLATWLCFQRLTTPHPVTFILLASTLAVITGHLCYRYIEQPLTRWLSARFHSPHISVPAPEDFAEPVPALAP
jgi:exopolysaccharide production protein ExoZ